MAHTPQALPPEITVLERDWLSANNIVFQGAHSGTAVVDTGYHSHAEHTVALLGAALLLLVPMRVCVLLLMVVLAAQVVLLNSCFVGDKADEQLANLKLELAGLDIGLTVI